MKKYKLTDQNMRTRNGFQWELGKEVTTSGKGGFLCNDSWLHCYSHPLIAVLMNPRHANIQNPKLFEVKALGKHLNDGGLKEGCTKMTLVEEIALPVISTTQKVAFAILCSLKVYKDKKYAKWADNWLKGNDRSSTAAADAAAYAAYAADAADAAAYAADAAAYAADAAADAAAYAAADAAADAAAYAAYAAAYAADAAAYAAYAADDAADARAINLIAIAKEAMNVM